MRFARYVLQILLLIMVDEMMRHCLSKKLKDNVKKLNDNKSISNFFNEKETSSAINAEAFFSNFLIEHNISLSAADHAGPLFRKMFPDSGIAKKYGSGRSKTSSIIRSMAEEKQTQTVTVIQKSAFSLATDASNDTNDKKIYPLVVSYFNEEDGKIKTTLLSLLQSSDATAGEAIYKMINAELLCLKISWDRCVSFSSDNAANMIGKNKGLTAFISNKNPHIKFIGCCCHLLHRALQKASKVAIPVDIEFFVIQIYYYLDKSSKRKHELVAYQQLCNEKIHKILKHVNTRWLSLETSLGRIIEQWEPLKLFFNPEDNTSDKSMQYITIKEMFLDNKTKLYALFLSNIIPQFNNINKSLQQEKTCIHVLKETLFSLYFNLIARFVTPAAVEKSDSILSLNYKKPKNQKLNDDIVIGAKTRQYLNTSGLSPEEKEQFFSCEKKFFFALHVIMY